MSEREFPACLNSHMVICHANSAMFKETCPNPTEIFSRTWFQDYLKKKSSSLEELLESYANYKIVPIYLQDPVEDVHLVFLIGNNSLFARNASISV